MGAATDAAIGAAGAGAAGAARIDWGVAAGSLRSRDGAAENGGNGSKSRGGTPP